MIKKIFKREKFPDYSQHEIEDHEDLSDVNTYMEFDTFVGIDYSITSPAMTFYTREKGEFSFSNCQSWFFNSYKTRSFQNKVTNVFEIPYPPPEEVSVQKYEHIAEDLIEIIETRFNPERTLVGIEGYSYGSKGKVFHLAENCGILKYLLYKHGFQIVHEDLMAPSRIKKFATGKGNANKVLMYESFLEETGADILEQLQPEKKVDKSFVSDIVDSYYMCKYIEDLDKNEQIILNIPYKTKT